MASEEAFVQAMQSSMLVMAVIVAVAAVLIGLWAPGRNGSQLPVVRRLRARRLKTLRAGTDH